MSQLIKDKLWKISVPNIQASRMVRAIMVEDFAVAQESKMPLLGDESNPK